MRCANIEIDRDLESASSSASSSFVSGASTSRDPLLFVRFILDGARYDC